MNPMDDFADRRTPPQSDIMALMIELRAIANAAREELRDFRTEREAWRDQFADLRADMRVAAEERAALRAEIKPLTETMHQARAIRWVVTGLVATVIAMASSYAWLKAHVFLLFWNGGSR